jgi:hypothetical protein
MEHMHITAIYISLTLGDMAVFHPNTPRSFNIVIMFLQDKKTTSHKSSTPALAA